MEKLSAIHNAPLSIAPFSQFCGLTTHGKRDEIPDEFPTPN